MSRRVTIKKEVFAHGGVDWYWRHNGEDSLEFDTEIECYQNALKYFVELADERKKEIQKLKKELKVNARVFDRLWG